MKPILVLGAYGLAGRAIVARLAAKTGHTIIAAGRNSAKLQMLSDSMGAERVRTRVLDAADAGALRAACEDASFVINAVGPFARTGADIARVVVEAGLPYLDCANEQTHYERLGELDPLARRRGVPIITAAGAIPGLSTMLVARLIGQLDGAAEVDCCWAQYRHAYADTGLASIMGGILEAVAHPVALKGGQLAPVVMGRGMRAFELDAPFGLKTLMEVPTIDALTIAHAFPLREYHTWFYMGELPTWLLDVVRVLAPQRRRWAYRLIESIMRRLNDRDTARAIAVGVGPECLVHVTARSATETRQASILFRDGAAATACLPAYLAALYFDGGIPAAGLMTPLDLVEAAQFEAIAGDAVCGRQ